MGKKTADKTVYQNIGWAGFGSGSNAACVDVKDGRIARIRPMDMDEKYSPEEFRPFVLKARGKEFHSGTRTLIPPLSIAYKRRAYSPNRVPYPLKRVDWNPDGERNTQNRGISKYERISWDEAAKICAKEIKRIVEKYGSTAVYCQGDGHGETKTIAGGHGCNTRLMDVLGGCTLQARQPDSWEGWYWGAKHIWGQDPVGKQAHVVNLFKDISENTEALLFIGCDPEVAPWGWGGQMASRMCYWWRDLGIKQIFICPDLNYGAANYADKWIPVLPNTDAALHLAIAYTWIKEGTYKKEYVQTHSVGFDWFERYVTGGEDGVPKTPKWAEGKCGVPSRQIKALARYWAKHVISTNHCNGGGYIRSVFSHEPARLEVALLTMQGLGAPGVGMMAMTEWKTFGLVDCNPMPASEFGTYMGSSYTGHVPGSGLRWFIPQTLFPDAIKLPEGEKLSWYGHVVCGLPREDQFNQYEYPMEGASRIHMVWTDTPCWSTCWNGGHRMQDAIRDESIEFYLVQHPWMENDTLFADIILPVTTIFEEDDIITITQVGTNEMILDEEPAIEPQGEACSDSMCVYRIAQAMGDDIADRLMRNWCGAEESLSKAGDFEDGGGVQYSEDDEKDFDTSDQDYMDTMATHFTGGAKVDHVGWDAMKRIAWEGGGMQPRMDFDEFMKKGYYVIPFKQNWEDDPVGLRGFYEDPEAHPLDTPTGKVEFYSTGIADNWPDDQERPPVPHWIEESEHHHERLTNDRGKDYPFLLVSNHPRWRVHANHDDLPWLREIDGCKVKGPDGYAYEPVWINPIDARARDIHTGDIVGIYNERGMVLGGAIVTERIMPHALSQDHGSRVDSIVTGMGGLDRGGANNLICPGATTSKNAPGEVTNGFLVNIKKVDVFELAEKYPEEFNRDYDPDCGMMASARIVGEES